MFLIEQDFTNYRKSKIRTHELIYGMEWKELGRLWHKSLSVECIFSIPNQMDDNPFHPISTMSVKKLNCYKKGQHIYQMNRPGNEYYKFPFTKG